jgi:hypothetical protein
LDWVINPIGDKQMTKIILVLAFAVSSAFAQSTESSDSIKDWLKDPQTIAQLGMVGTTYAMDAKSTLAGNWTWKHSEYNPLLGSHAGPARVSTYFAVSFVITGASNYLFRHHNRLRWISTSAITGVETFWIIHNHKSDNRANSVCINNPACFPK